MVLGAGDKTPNSAFYSLGWPTYLGNLINGKLKRFGTNYLITLFTIISLK